MSRAYDGIMRRSPRWSVCYSQFEPDGLEDYVPAAEHHRAAFEDRYGVPTDVDAVWRDRDDRARRTA